MLNRFALNQAALNAALTGVVFAQAALTAGASTSFVAAQTHVAGAPMVAGASASGAGVRVVMPSADLTASAAVSLQEAAQRHSAAWVATAGAGGFSGTSWLRHAGRVNWTSLDTASFDETLTIAGRAAWTTDNLALVALNPSATRAARADWMAATDIALRAFQQVDAFAAFESTVSALTAFPDAKQGTVTITGVSGFTAVPTLTQPLSGWWTVEGGAAYGEADVTRYVAADLQGAAGTWIEPTYTPSGGSAQHEGYVRWQATGALTSSNPLNPIIARYGVYMDSQPTLSITARLTQRLRSVAANAADLWVGASRIQFLGAALAGDSTFTAVGGVTHATTAHLAADGGFSGGVPWVNYAAAADFPASGQLQLSAPVMGFYPVAGWAAEAQLGVIPTHWVLVPAQAAAVADSGFSAMEVVTRYTGGDLSTGSELAGVADVTAAAAAAWVNGGSYFLVSDLTSSEPAPAGRTFTVPPEDRAFAVPWQDRTFMVG